MCCGKTVKLIDCLRPFRLRMSGVVPPRLCLMAGAYRLYLVLKSIQPSEATCFNDRQCNRSTALNHLSRYFVVFFCYI